MPTAAELAALGPENTVAVHRLLPNPLFVVSGKPQQFLASPLCLEGELFLSRNIADALYLDYFGIDPHTIELFVQSNAFPVTVYISIPNPQNPGASPLMQAIRIPRQATLVTFADPYALADLLGVDEVDPLLLGQLRRTEGANEYYDVTPPGEIVPRILALGLIDARTIVIAQGVEADIREVFSDAVPSSALLERLKHTPVDAHDVTILTSLEGVSLSPEDLQQMLDELEQGWGLTPLFSLLLKQHLRALTFSLNASAPQGQPFVTIRIEGRDEKGADLIGEQIRELVIMGQTFLAAMGEEREQMLPIPAEFAVSLLNAVSVDVREAQVHVVLHNFESLIPTVAGWIGNYQTALVQTELQEQREELHRWRSHQLAGLAEISVMYYMEHGKFPSDILDTEGNPLLSWRVALLPSIGLGHIYNQFNRDEPWDSETNLEAQKTMPSIFLAHTQDVAPPKTVVRFFDSPGTPLSDRNLRSETLEHPQSTLMYLIVAPEYAVEWTKPESLEFDIDHIAEILGDSPLGITFSRRIGAIPVPQSTSPNYEHQKQYVEALVKGLPLPQQEAPQQEAEDVSAPPAK